MTHGPKITLNHVTGHQVFRAHRKRLFGLAYRLLGSAAAAEDVPQDPELLAVAPRRRCRKRPKVINKF
jgi:DNA-directed RNA polymerase specialized sigma24 family protein